MASSLATSWFLSVMLILMLITTQQAFLTVAASPNLLGVCYGTLGDNLPPPNEVVNLYKKYGISHMRIFDPNHETLQALSGSGIDVIVGTTNGDLPNLAASQAAADGWVQTNIVPYAKETNISFVTAGNEVIGGQYARFVAPAMTNLRKALDSSSLNHIKVSTVVHGRALVASYPPSQGAFSNDMKAILEFLSNQNIPESRKLMVNLYPYYAYVSDPINISLEFAIFTATKPAFQDGNLSYWSLFDAQLDAFYAALEKAGAPNVGVIITETGWPTAGNGNFTTTSLAQTYNQNLRTRINKGGSPKRPNDSIETYLFAMFNEDLKPAGREQNWGLFYPNATAVYPFF